ncbi:MAG: hypothetical protein K6E48_01755 [Lachnospiraceae bacterium]|nr:hypothetical protein [Lachnospiraceae bacterium]
MQKRIEGLWDCAYCGTKEIKARFDTCPGCGKARGIDTEFYMAEDTEAATLTEAEKAKTTNEPDWLCEYCDTYNRADVDICRKCGSRRKDSKDTYGTLHKLTGLFFGKKNKEQ